MQKFSTLRLVLPVVAIVALVLISSCSSSSRKYGCPNKLQTSSFIR